MGKAREQEIRVTALGMIALVVLASVLAVSAAMLLGGRHFSFPDLHMGQDVGSSSATYQAH
jgi:hypothetical protein